MTDLSKNTQKYWNSRVEAMPLGVGAGSVTDQELRATGDYAKATLHCLTRYFPLHILRKSTVMDFGSGSGRLAKLFAPHVKKIICAEVSDKFLEKSKKNLAEFDNVEYLLIKSPPSFDYRIGEIDLTYSYASFSYMPNEEVFFQTIKEIDRVSKSFCIEMNRVPQKPKSNFTLLNPEVFDIRLLEAFVADDENIYQYFDLEEYLIEYLSPEPKVRGKNRFFYKIHPDIQNEITYFGPRIYEKNQYFEMKQYSGMVQPVFPKRVIRRLKFEFQKMIIKVSVRIRSK